MELKFKTSKRTLLRVQINLFYKEETYMNLTYSNKCLEKFNERIRSDKGFYVGDLSRALKEEHYDHWVGNDSFADGAFKAPGTDYLFAVGRTSPGSSLYVDSQGNEYGIDVEALGIVPVELTKSIEGGHYFPGAGVAHITYVDWRFTVELPDGTVLTLKANQTL